MEKFENVKEQKKTNEKSSQKIIRKYKLKENEIDINKNQKGKTPEKKKRINKLETKSSKKKILFPKKIIKNSNSVNLTRKIKGKDNK